MPSRNDPKAVDSAVAMRDFPGLVTNADPHDLKPGAAQVQVNVASSRPGELRAREGWRRLLFDE
jgi:hypothetical protein